jgi:hypothetical protein
VTPGNFCKTRTFSPVETSREQKTFRNRWLIPVQRPQRPVSY